jgi:DNA-binding Xre family transcriptional regulator
VADKNTAPNEYRAAIGNLKQTLRQRRLTYQELAKGIGLSESGVKKIFSAKDGSFQRLAQICRYVGISMNELIEDNRTFNVTFTDEQQKEFVKNPKLFQYYWLLAYERLSKEVSQAKLQLSTAEAFRLARKLDTLSLIKLLPGDRIRLPSIKAVRWVGEGEFQTSLYRNWSRALLDAVTKSEPKDGEFFLLRYLQMTPKTFTEFIAAQKALENEFIRRSIQEMRARPSDLEHVRWLIAVDNRSFVTANRLDSR